jgi:type VI protein secretion system component Hcp
MAKHVERESTNPVIELTADELQGVAGGFITVRLTDVNISSYSQSSHETASEPAK